MKHKHLKRLSKNELWRISGETVEKAGKQVMPAEQASNKLKNKISRKDA